MALCRRRRNVKIRHSDTRRWAAITIQYAWFSSRMFKRLRLLECDRLIGQIKCRCYTTLAGRHTEATERSLVGGFRNLHVARIVRDRYLLSL
jgi:hypothetical protein